MRERALPSGVLGPRFVGVGRSTGEAVPRAACMAAAYLKLCPGKTRSSWSAVVMKVGGYLVPGLMLWSGEYL